MIFLADESVDQQIVIHLRKDGHEVIAVSEEEQIDHFERYVRTISAENLADNALLNQIFQEALGEVWGWNRSL